MMMNSLINMCRKYFALVAVLLPLSGYSANPEITDLKLTGQIEGENIIFSLDFKVADVKKGAVMPIVSGDVAYLDGKLPRGSELYREGRKYMLKFGSGGFFSSSGSQSVSFRFASKAQKEGEWRKTGFEIPSASIRRLAIICDRDDLEMKFPSGLDVTRAKNKDGKMEISAFLGAADRFDVTWKPEIKRFDSELVVSCDANCLAIASVGVLKIDTVYTYRVIQGAMSKAVLALPESNVTRVTGEDIQDWQIDKTDSKKQKLVVALSRPRDGVYRLRVESELVLPQFPNKFNLPVLVPENVLRASGFMMVGTDSAIKLVINKASGLTQIDQGSFQILPVDNAPSQIRRLPSKSVFTYQFANMPFSMEVSADDIVPNLSVESQLALAVGDNELDFNASLQIDVKDAPARELVLHIDSDPAWTVTSVTGNDVSEPDTDVREEISESGGIKKTNRIIYVPFRNAVTGMTLVNVRMERVTAKDASKISAPQFSVSGARSERGFIVAVAEKGVRLKVDSIDELNEVHTGSVPMRIEGAQHAFRFKGPSWRLGLGLERAEPCIYSEVFHLVSLGEGVMYCSAAVTYHISGAPVNEFKFRIPKKIESVDLAGADIEGWTRNEDVCTVRLQSKIIGDYTLLVTYDRQYRESGADIEVGEIDTIGAESEVGYVAIASSLSLKLSEAKPLPASVIKIDRNELPSGYSAPITDPILATYKFVRPQHSVAVKVEPYETEQLLGQVVDFLKMSTAISKDGECVTTAHCYIKNASRQFLLVKLPAGAALWSVKCQKENGAFVDANAQESAKKDGSYLVPVPRLRDPNTPVIIEITYAQSFRALSLLKTGLTGLSLKSIALPDTHNAYMGWQVSVPTGYSISDVSGGMSYDLENSRESFNGVAAKVVRVFKALKDGPRGYTLKKALSGGIDGQRSVDLTRALTMSSEKPNEVSVKVVPGWMGSASSATGFVLFILHGVIIGAYAIIKRKGPFVHGLALTMTAYAISCSAAGRSVLAVLVAAALLLVLAVFAVRVLQKIFFAVSVWRSRKKQEAAQEQEVAEEIQPFVPSDDARGGYAGLQMLVAILFVSLTAAAVMSAEPKVQALSLPVCDTYEIRINAPKTARDAEQSAKVEVAFEMNVTEVNPVPLLGASNVLTSFEFDNGKMEIRTILGVYYLFVKEPGKYKGKISYRAPVSQSNGKWMLAVPVLPNLKNSVVVDIPEKGFEVEAVSAVMMKCSDVKEMTHAEAVLGPVTQAVLTWKPKQRRTTTEQVVVYCDINTVVKMLPGLVDFLHLVNLDIAQGEMREFGVKVPAGMTVTSVGGTDIATWSFDQDKGKLDIILEKAVSGKYLLSIATQMAKEGLPYNADIGLPVMDKVSKQRGSIAISVSESVQLKVDGSAGFSPMNLEDFSAEAARLALSDAVSMRDKVTIRKSYRYQTPDSGLKVSVEKVLPEIRISESGSVSISDERTMLATKISLFVAKSGIFSVDMQLPEGFDVESITGRDVSHWDESKDGKRTVTVHFSRQITEAADVNVALSRIEKGIGKFMDIPRINVKDAAKHSGKLTVQGERGVRLMVESQSGVDIKKTSEEGIVQAGVLVFDILRPDWSLKLRTDVMAPVLKPEILQVVDVTEGMIQYSYHVHYKIDNAGVKVFRFKSPKPGTPIAVSGKSLSRFVEIDKTNGIWQVELHNKVEDAYDMLVKCQMAHDLKEKSVKIMPLQILDAEEQRGYIAVMSSGRVQIDTLGETPGLKMEDARNIPDSYKAGDLSSAVKSYRIVRQDYKLELSVVRNKKAEVLPASISNVRVASVMSHDGKLLNEMTLSLSVGQLDMLKVLLPGKNDALWNVTVDGKTVAASRDSKYYCIPLSEQEGGRLIMVKMVYSSDPQSGLMSSGWKFTMPKLLGLPAQDIEWKLYALPGYKYYGFDGTLEYDKQSAGRLQVFDAGIYKQRNKSSKDWNEKQAKEELSNSSSLAKAGKNNEAIKAVQQALNYSQGDININEDARVQLRNLVRKEVKKGLLDRRGAVRYNNGIIDDVNAPQQRQGMQGGAISDKENVTLDQVADRMFDQQAAAAGVLTAINIEMPESGRMLRFYRDVQIDPDGDLSIEFKMSRGSIGKFFSKLWPLLIVFGICVFGASRVSGKDK